MTPMKLWILTPTRSISNLPGWKKPWNSIARIVVRSYTEDGARKVAANRADEIGLDAEHCEAWLDANQTRVDEVTTDGHECAIIEDGRFD